MGYYDEYCSKNKIEIFPRHQEIIDTFYKGDYRELVAVLGRRSGKNMLAINIALRELEYLLSLDDPFKYYKLAEGNPIYILIVSESSSGAKILHVDLKSVVSQSETLKPHLSTDRDGLDKITFLSNADKKQKRKGSIVVMSGHSNSESFLGKRIFTLILNEIALFKSDRDNAITGDRIYSALGPATMDFQKPGKTCTTDAESKIISISTPRHEGDMLHRLYTADRLRKMTVQYPTWEMNPNFSEEKLRQEFKFMSDIEFNSQFGAEFIPDGNKTLSMRLPSTTIDKLKRMAREQAYKSNKDVSYTDMIRFAIDEYVQEVTI